MVCSRTLKLSHRMYVFYKGNLNDADFHRNQSKRFVNELKQRTLNHNILPEKVTTTIEGKREKARERERQKAGASEKERERKIARERGKGSARVKESERKGK